MVTWVGVIVCGDLVETVRPFWSEEEAMDMLRWNADKYDTECSYSSEHVYTVVEGEI